MKLRLFVIGSSTVLMAWLATTYFLETPLGSYPRLGRGSAPISAKNDPGKALELADPADNPVVVSK
jgi:hypothetical protein